MSSVPSTPKSVRKLVKSSTPRTVIKRNPVKKTILTSNFDDSGIEDETYINENTMISESDFDEEEEEEEAEVVGELLDEINHSNGVNGSHKAAEATPEVVQHSMDEDWLVRFIKKHEIGRKLFHSSIGVLTLWLYTQGVHQHQLILPLSIIFVIVFLNDFIRFRNPDLNKKIVNFMWFVIREKEINSYNGVLWYLAGLVLVFSIFPKDISLMSVLLLSWADTAASTFGRQFGKYTPKIGNAKSLAGCIASFLTGVALCCLIYMYFIPNYNVNVPEDILWNENSSHISFPVYAIISGLIASFTEVIDIYGIDDNFTIPVLSSILIYGLIKVTQI